MSVVLLGGLITSTLLHLFILPALYLRFSVRPAPARTPMPRGAESGLSTSSD
jgi:Cu/Ag efflux pump CusA